MSTLFGDLSQQPGFAFPQSLTEQYKPRVLDEFVGLTKQKAILEKLIAQPRPCGLLFVGGPGTGKTTMAFAYARAIQAEIHHVPSQDCNLENLQSISAICHRVPYDFMTGTPCKWHVVIIDEADQMSEAAQTFLLSRLDGSNQCPATIWILTANGDERFKDRFLSRLLKLPKFNSYGAGDDIRALLTRIWKQRTNAEEPDFARMATGNVREALQALEVELLSVPEVKQ